MNNNPDSIGNDTKFCSIKVSFTGANTLFTNGAGARNVSLAGYGVGFTVSGSVQGQIGKVDVTPGRTDTVNASGAWTIQQYVAHSTQATYDLSGSKVFYRSVATKPDGPFPEFRQINGSNFTYFDFPGPITPLALDDGRSANLTSYQGEWDFAVKVINGRDQAFGVGATGYANKDIPNERVTARILLAADDDTTDAAMVAAIWAEESNFAETPGGDAGPAQLTSWWRNNHEELIEPGAYGSWNGRTDKPFDGNVQMNVNTLGNIVRFSRTRYGSLPEIPYHYGPGDPEESERRRKQGLKGYGPKTIKKRRVQRLRYESV